MIPTKKPQADNRLSQQMRQHPDTQIPDIADGKPKSSGKIWLWIAIPVIVAAAVGVVLYLDKEEKRKKTEELAEILENEYDRFGHEEIEEEADCYIEEFTPVDMKIVDDTETSVPVVVEAPAETPVSDILPGTEDLNNVREHKNEVVVEEKIPVTEEEKIFTSVEEMPKFPGGESELLKYIANHIAYPADAAEEYIQGKVVVQFVVTRDGSVGEVKVARGKHPSLDREAVRVVKTLPKFIPGKMNGQPVNVWYTLPITFKLQGV